MITFPPQTQPINAKLHEGEPILYINWSFSGLPFLCRWLTPRRVFFVKLWYFVTSRHFPQKQHKKYSKTKLMTAQIFQKTTTGAFPITIVFGWLHLEGNFLDILYWTLWLLPFNNHTILSLWIIEKTSGRCFRLEITRIKNYANKLMSQWTYDVWTIVFTACWLKKAT